MGASLGRHSRRKALTDSEYVELVRRGLRRSKRLNKWLAFLSAGVGLAMVYVVLTLIQIVWEVRALQGGNPFIAAVLSGGIFGMVLGWFTWHTVELFAKALVMLAGDRTSELLVKYHDILAARKEIEPFDSAQSSDKA